MINSKMLGMLAAAFVAGSFVASPELRADAANTVGSLDIINNSILSVDIKDLEVKTVDIGGAAVTNGKLANGAVNSAKIADGTVGAVDIGTDAVGASELQGVAKLLYAQCSLNFGTVQFPHGSGISGIFCDAPGAAQGDAAVATINGGSNGCVTVTKAVPGPLGTADKVALDILNICNDTQTPGALSIGIVVFDK